MNLGAEIFVLIVVCIGVAFSSPANVSGPDGGPKEKLPVVDPVTPVDNSKVTVLPPVNQTLQPSQPVNGTSNNSTNKDAQVVPAKLTPVIVDNKNASADVKNTTAGNSTVDGAKTEVVPQNHSTTVTPAPTTEKTTTMKPTQSPVPITITTQKPTTTVTPITTTSAVINAQTTAAEHIKPASTSQERQFDGPSFVGGIVLTIGLTAIGFIAFKFYKSGKIERNYRTL